MKKYFLFLISLVTGMFALNFASNVDAFSSTVMLEARSKMDIMLNQDLEMRKNMSQIIDCFIESTNISNPRIISGKDLQTAKITYLKNKAFTVNSARSCSPAGEQGGTGIATISWTHRNVSFWISKSQAGVNDYDYQTQLASNLYQAEQALFYDAVDAYALAYLAANKSTVNDAHGQPNTFNVDVMEVAKVDVKRFYTLLRSDMKLNNFKPTTGFYDIRNSAFEALHSEFGFGGISNTQDNAVANNIKTFDSNAIAIGAYSSYHYAVPFGGLYLLDRIPAMYDGEIRGAKQMTQFASKLYPGKVLQLTIDKNCTDTSLTGGQVADAVDVYTLGWDFAAGALPLSAAGETMIMPYATLAI